MKMLDAVRVSTTQRTRGGEYGGLACQQNEKPRCDNMSGMKKE